MTRVAILLFGVASVALAACGNATSQPGAANTDAAGAAPATAGGIVMDAETQTRMGVRVDVARSFKAPRTLEGFARVLDVSALAAVEAEVGAAFAAASASQEEYQRLTALAAQDQAASARSVEVAQAQAAADSARAQLAGQRIGLEWGAGIAKMSNGARAGLLADIANGNAALVRVDAPGLTSGVSAMTVDIDGSGVETPVSMLGPAAASDTRLQSAGLLGIVRGSAARNLLAGKTVGARLQTGNAEDGLLLPGSALIRVDGDIYVYVRTGPELFERRSVAGGRPVSGDWFVTGVISSTDEIVVDGASSVVAVESASQSAG